MSKYIFVLGKDEELSLAELYAVYPKADFSEIGDGFVILKLDQAFSQMDLDRLGGVIKVAEVKRDEDRQALIPSIFEQIFYSKKDGKIQYAVSVIGWAEANLRSLLGDLKKAFKEEGVNSRFANQDFKNLSAAQNKALQGKGHEFLVAKKGGQFYIGQTVAVQNIDAYSERDYQKPFRSMKVGMLPPKLAQILINLTGAEGKIWDPFCGGGVLLMEGLLMGHDMLGSDIDLDALEGAWRNTLWVRERYRLKNTVDLLEHDATEPLIEQNSPNAIACEGYLGPPQHGPLSRARQGQLIPELERLYIRFFQALKKSRFGGPIVIALPFFRTENGSEIVLGQALEAIEKMGFRSDFLLPNSELRYLKYARPDQWVGRMVIRFSI